MFVLGINHTRSLPSMVPQRVTGDRFGKVEPQRVSIRVYECEIVCLIWVFLPGHLG